MLKIIIVTFNCAYNYGAWLQMYALQKFLKKNHFETEILNYRPAWKDNVPTTKSVKRLIIDAINKMREHKFRKDSRRYLQMTPICQSVGDLAKWKQPDVYIAGSDQIWNPKLTHGFDDIFYLNFSTSARKLFYAASVGFDNINENMLRKMEAKIDLNAIISVRERLLYQVLHDNTSLHVTHVLDPVFLLEPSDYKQLMVPSPYKNYLLLYLVEDNENCYKLAKKIAQEKKLKVIQVGKIRKMDGIEKTYATLSPTEFLGMVYGADYIVTNSFHGTALSIFFRKQFATIPVSVYQSRIASLLATMELEDVLVENMSTFCLKEIDYAAHEQVISDVIQNSKNFLLCSLECIR